MLCFEICINGERKGLIGYEYAEEYGVYISTHPQLAKDFCTISAEGAFPSDSTYSDELKWLKSSAKAGDEVTIRVLESTSADIPTITKYQEGAVSESKTAMLCSNCGNSQFETDQFVHAGKVSLCKECITLFSEMINDQ